ncbi:MAG: phosphomannomutase/phosphoglucomutase [Planctomycetota bacterium]|jgi:phosphomannomutase|nr:phosphomannomutase/phosphoglucomutase [Planctomycetota bacterium]
MPVTQAFSPVMGFAWSHQGMGENQMGIFKAYDVRGIYPDQVNESLFEAIGQVAPKVLECQSVVVSRDMRKSGESLSAAMIRGLTKAGVDVTDIGMASTPMLYFATAFLKAGAGVQITASHNPAAYNGCKWCREDAIPVAYDSGLADMEKMVSHKTFLPPSKSGGVKTVSVESEYRANLLKYADGIKPLTVVIDCGNGVMGAFLPQLLAKLPCEVIPLFFEPDGSFPNHEANPINPNNMRDLVSKVKESGADLGVAFDGDGDRSMYVDETGEIIPADFITALLAGEMLDREPGATIFYYLRSSKVCKEEIERRGGIAKMCRVGHSFIKAMMREDKAIFAGELSGHFYFRDLHYTDNAEMAMLAVLAVLSKRGSKMSELIRPFKKYFATGELNFQVDNTDAAVARVEKTFKGSAKEIAHLDGLSMYFADYWFNIRASNTEPLLRLNLEADNAAARDRAKIEVEKVIGGKPESGKH